MSEFEDRVDAETAAVTSEVPPAWGDLVVGLVMLARSQTNAISPLHCEHDQLTVMADRSNLTDEDVEKLSELGFEYDEGDETFYSFRFGSA